MVGRGLRVGQNGGVLTELLIRDVGVIEEVTLELAPGLNVLTGETGAGKTMVVSALELLLGARADADSVRAGATAALVEGRFEPPPAGADDWLGDGDEDLVVSREVAAADAGSGGRSRARLGGRLAPASALTEVVGRAVEVHGQSEAVRLAQPAVQRELLDRSGGPELADAAARYAAAHRAWREAAEELERLRGGERERLRELDRLRYELDEIDGLGLRAGEEEELAADLRRMERAEALGAAAAGAAAALTDDGGARDALGAAVAALRGVAGLDEALASLLGRAEGLAAEAQDLGLELGAYAAGLEADPRRLEALRERHAALVRLTRKYGSGQEAVGGVDTAAVLAYAEQARARAATLESGDARAAALDAEVERLEAAVGEAAAALRARRRAAGERLAAAVADHLRELAMAEARLEVVVEPIPPAAHGADRVELLLAANAGEPARPLGKVASGGERSRIALALRLALADATGGADGGPAVLVFDEVDAGVGGATALAVGRKLARLARGRQVLCVTHLAQLAAFADAHFVVAKRNRDGRTVAAVERVDDAARVTELSRMLSGTPDSARAAEHAEELRALAVAER